MESVFRVLTLKNRVRGLRVVREARIGARRRINARPHWENWHVYDQNAVGVLQLSKDPIFHRGGLNLYLYSGNNPINFKDPTGLFITLKNPEYSQVVAWNLRMLTGHKVSIGCNGRVSFGDRLGDGYMTEDEVGVMLGFAKDFYDRDIYIIEPGSPNYNYLINNRKGGQTETWGGSYTINYAQEGTSVPPYRILGHELYVHSGSGLPDESDWGYYPR